jgi:hypothetical protein
MVSAPVHIVHNSPFLKNNGEFRQSGNLVSSTNKTDRHDNTEILLEVALNTMNQTNPTS